MATGLKPGIAIDCTTLGVNFVPHPLTVWAWQLGVSHMFENCPYYASRWSLTISGNKVAMFSTIGFL